MIGGRIDLGAGLFASSSMRDVPKRAPTSASSRSPSNCQDARATVRCRWARSRSQSGSVAGWPQDRKVLHAKLFELPQLAGEALQAIGEPCVRLARQKPPLRPVAAQPISCDSSSTTSALGFRSLARRAVRAR